MELFRTDEFYIFVKDQHSLWWDRQTGAFIPKTGWDLADAEDPTCLGICHGLIGKVEHPSVFDPRLIVIKECSPVGKIHGDHEVFKIKSIAFLNLGMDNPNLNLQQCAKHKTIPTPKRGAANPFMDLQKNAAFTKTLGTLKSAGNAIKSTTQQAAAMATGSPLKKDAKDKEKFEKQIVEEFYKIFTDTNSFYFSRTCDITSSLQRLCSLEKSKQIEASALWRTVDDRFFWNKNMLKQLISLDNSLCDPWIMPIIQGYIQIEECKVEVDQDIRGVKTSPKYEIFKLSIVSRRSRFRAGTRYKRRGVDDQGECANYVETEQLIAYQHHEVSFVQVRGSVPVYWSQPGYKYRPPPRIDKGEEETKSAFEKHFKNEIARYGPVCVINLVDQSGKEKVIWDSYSHHIFEFNSPHVTYVTFDFHEYCRGMHFENVSILINSIADIIKDMNYCWRDRQGHICSQLGVFRVNCIDCLDRTNVVQTALAKSVMEIQFCKLGLITPEGTIPDSIKNTFQLLWANNGDTISKQYAGTNALKGDYTRTGERKFTGIMKDGMNSANRFYRNHFADSVRQCCLDLSHGSPVRVNDFEDSWSRLNTFGGIASELVPLGGGAPHYIPHIALEQEFELANALYYMYRYYLSRFKDSTRQGTIDLMLGNGHCVSEDLFNETRSNTNFEEDSASTAEHVKLLIEDCKKMLINNPEIVLGAWGLINADPFTGDPSETEMDSILILTKDSYFVADYDDQVDKVTKYQRVCLDDITVIESGIPESSANIFKSNSKNFYSIRLNYKVNGVTGYYHMFRSTNLQFFNNMAVFLKNEEEEIESLKAICEAFSVALDIGGLPPIPYKQGQKLDRRKSKVISDNSASNVYLDIVGLPHLTRNVSETQLLALKNAGTKALSNMSQQFSRLNRLGSSLKPKRRSPKFTIGKKVESSSESDEEYETSIFQPDNCAESGTSLQLHSDSDNNIEQAVEVTEDSSKDSFLPSVGIVMGGSTNENGTSTMTTLLTESASVVNDEQLLSIMNNVTMQNPEIQINSGSFECSDTRMQPPTSLKLDKKYSHSSGEVRNEEVTTVSANTTEFETNISQSQSESALKNKLVSLTSPVANATKELVLSPFSKIAKGVQNLGANLDPRKMSSGTVRGITEKEYEEHKKLQEKWLGCKTRLIAL
ncbi:PREDICTED: phosphatidylinositide phosphatase SAC2 isoform X2 [Nicrophorus vespilloides]|uniref:Phosphatidylinositide phosphatase SAC2 isoform X2 n=1 Tax=Nicrophorus vespilloides TaxID=110193 RepID=A0ABM1M4S5_NICVS|nr:PREDICTED: phosphatidylinositide phosphatase SAC2 isoform X2 [Nicrophorus vespilloides]